jgi:hypothetical protein
VNNGEHFAAEENEVQPYRRKGSWKRQREKEKLRRDTKTVWKRLRRIVIIVMQQYKESMQGVSATIDKLECTCMIGSLHTFKTCGIMIMKRLANTTVSLSTYTQVGFYAYCDFYSTFPLAFDAGLQQTCFICNQVLSGDTESINLHIDGCLARMNSEDVQDEIALPSHNEATALVHSITDGEAAEALSAAEWEEYEWAGQRRVRATAMLEGGYGGKECCSLTNA